MLAFRLIVFEFHIVVFAFRTGHQKPHGHVITRGLGSPYLILTIFYPEGLWINLACRALRQEIERTATAKNCSLRTQIIDETTKRLQNDYKTTTPRYQ